MYNNLYHDHELQHYDLVQITSACLTKCSYIHVEFFAILDMAGLSPSDIGQHAQFLLVEFLRDRLQRVGMGDDVPDEILRKS